MCVYFFSSLISLVEKKSKHGNLPFSRIFCSKKVIVLHDKKIGTTENMRRTHFHGKFVEKYIIFLVILDYRHLLHFFLQVSL